MKSWYIFFFQVRGVAEVAIARRDWAFVERLWRDWSPGWELPAGELEAIKTTFRQPGVLGAALGYYRAMFDLRSRGGREAQARLARPIDVPTLALTGALDGCMDTRLHDSAMRNVDFAGGLRVVRIEQAGHFLHQEKPDEVNDECLLDWLARAAVEPSPCRCRWRTSPPTRQWGPRWSRAGRRSASGPPRPRRST